MVVQTKLADDIDSAGMEAQYDASAKKLLGHKNILSWIMKGCVDEYKDLSLQEIAECIEGTPEISRISVHRDMPDAEEIVGDNTEDVSARERTIYFDIRFRAIVPGQSEVLQIFLNLEIQRDSQLGYPLEKRIIYYLSRMISAQYGPVFTHSQYGKIRKVYSIWIIPDPAKYRRNTIRKLSWKAEDILGKYGGKKEDYDLMTGLILSLSGDEDESENQVLRLLDVLFSQKKEPEQKKEILEKDFQIPYTKEIGSEVENLCNLSQGIKEQGKAEGESLKLISLVRKKLAKRMSAEAIADILEEELYVIEKIALTIQENPRMDDDEIYQEMKD